MLEVLRSISGHIQVRRFDREMTTLGLNSAALILRCSLVSRASKKQIALRIAVRLVRGRPAVNMRALIDTFDLVEQALGRSVHFPNISSCVAETFR
ncbi:hypothetical protein ACVWYH_001939 [Bradyrhizobium sp. GM24.11]